MRLAPTRFKRSLVSDERLLDTRICDLPIRLKGSSLEPHIKRLYSELNNRSIRVKPHVWLSASQPGRSSNTPKASHSLPSGLRTHVLSLYQKRVRFRCYQKVRMSCDAVVT